MTPRKIAAKRKADWALALREGRVVRYFGGAQLTSYPTVERAQEALRLAWSARRRTARLPDGVTKTKPAGGALERPAGLTREP